LANPPISSGGQWQNTSFSKEFCGKQNSEDTKANVAARQALPLSEVPS
jgi:hypothetical protein